MASLLEGKAAFVTGAGQSGYGAAKVGVVFLASDAAAQVSGQVPAAGLSS